LLLLDVRAGLTGGARTTASTVDLHRFVLALAAAVVTGSWDSSVRLWDPRKPGAEAMKLAAPAKVLTMALLEDKSMLIAGTADRHIQFFDLRAGTAAKKRESTLKHQTRFIRAFPDESGYIIGSIEGRCGVEFVEDGEHASKKYAFKCHRTPDPAHPGEDRIFPVNACAFHPAYGTFATGGGDGTVLMWDYKAKKRLCRVRECETSVSSLAFNRCGNSGQDWLQAW
jgi:cell cycle arrest protein BUB3